MLDKYVLSVLHHSQHVSSTLFNMHKYIHCLVRNQLFLSCTGILKQKQKNNRIIENKCYKIDSYQNFHIIMWYEGGLLCRIRNSKFVLLQQHSRCKNFTFFERVLIFFLNVCIKTIIYIYIGQYYILVHKSLYCRLVHMLFTGIHLFNTQTITQNVINIFCFPKASNNDNGHTVYIIIHKNYSQSHETALIVLVN